MKQKILLFAGACVGGVAGYFLFFWIVRQGFYALMLPGVLVGFGAGLFPTRSIGPCVACGILALALGVFTEWRLAPFKHDGSLPYFLSHVHQLRPLTLIMIVLGGVIAFYTPLRRNRGDVARDPEMTNVK